MGMLVSIARTATRSKIGKWAVKNAPQILMGTSLLSGSGALVGTVIATKKSIEDIDEEKMRRAIEQQISKDDVVLTKKEIFQTCWKNYIAAAALAGGSATAGILAVKVEHGRALTYAALLGASESRLASMEAEMLEQLGDKKVKAIKDGAAQREIEAAKLDSPDCQLLDAGGSGEYWILDKASKMRLKGTKDRIERAIEAGNHVLELAAAHGIDDETFSVADFLEELGANSYDIPAAMRNLVWRSGETTTTGIKIRYGHTESGEPCYVLDYESVRPKWDELWDVFSY